LTGGGAPETRELSFSFVPLTDAAPFIVAHEKGMFAEQDIASTLRRETSWTGLRDSLNSGASHAAQMLFSMPLAAACGLLSTDQKPLIAPWVINRNGQGITLKKAYEGKVSGSAKMLHKAAIEGRDAGRPLVFGHTLRIGTHAMWLRYWLAAGGIDPTRDVALITVPPPQMVKNMRTAAMDGFCVGEPWNARAVADNLGFTAITSQEIWPDHPEKVCAFTEDFARENPRTVVAVLKALYQASQWLDAPANNNEAAALLSHPNHLNCAQELIRSRLGTEINYGDGRKVTLSQGLTFSERGAGRPQEDQALWFLTQLRRWGLHFGPPDYHAISARVIRTEFYEQALEELGVPEGRPGTQAGSLSLFDGKPFDPADPERYARSFELNNLQG
jgi:nitrate/nitrite transport system substrate-binding protein